MVPLKHGDYRNIIRYPSDNALCEDRPLNREKPPQKQNKNPSFCMIQYYNPLFE